MLSEPATTGSSVPSNLSDVPRPRHWYGRWWGWLIIVVVTLAVWFVGQVAYLLWRGGPDIYPSSTSQFTAAGASPVFAPIDKTRLIRDTSPSLGSPSANVTIVEFADFECPFCEQAFPTIRSLAAQYGDRIHVVFRNYPVPSLHEHALAAAEAAACAQVQGKFWAYHDKLFQNQNSLDDQSLQGYAVAAGLDSTKFAQCVATHQEAATVQRDMTDGNVLGVRGTPTWFINGVKKIEGVIDPDSFHRAIEALLQASSRGSTP